MYKTMNKLSKPLALVLALVMVLGVTIPALAVEGDSQSANPTLTVKIGQTDEQKEENEATITVTQTKAKDDEGEEIDFQDVTLGILTTEEEPEVTEPEEPEVTEPEEPEVTEPEEPEEPGNEDSVGESEDSGDEEYANNLSAELELQYEDSTTIKEAENQLKAFIDKAKAVKIVKVSETEGKEIPTDQKWTTKEEQQAFNDALDKALNTKVISLSGLDKESKNLSDAISNYEEAKKDGIITHDEVKDIIDDVANTVKAMEEIKDEQHK